MPRFTKDLKCQSLPPVNGFRTIHQRIEMPILMSNRSLFTTYYDIDGLQPGEYQFISSSWGNEAYQLKYSKLAGRDVIAQLNLNYIGIRPVKNAQNEITGTHVQQVQSVSMNGMIPDMYMTKHSKRSAMQIINMITFLQTTTEELCRCKRHYGWEQKYQPLLKLVSPHE